MYCIVYYTAIMVETIPFHSHMVLLFFQSLRVLWSTDQQTSLALQLCRNDWMGNAGNFQNLRNRGFNDEVKENKKISQKDVGMKKSASGPQCKPTRIPRSIFVVKQAIPDTFMDFLQALTLQIPYVRKLIFTHE